jgi:quercetin dioxygenase-like cupin family protein
MALAKGAMLFEKHVGLPTPEWPLNAYSANPEQVAIWLEAAAEAVLACGTTGERHTPTPEEQESLHSLQRGVFVHQPLAAGERLDPAKVLLAMPTVPGQITARDLSKYVEFTALEPIKALGPVLGHQVRRQDHREQVLGIVQQVRALLEASHTVVGQHTGVEISHHYGLEKFPEVGATILNIVNRVYCKKLIVLLPGQRHPEQHHQKKEETFHVLHGELCVRLDGVEHLARPGDVITVERGVRHEFWTKTGTVIEEVSSTHFSDDSYYTDPTIAANPNRKTLLTYFFG